MPDITLMQAKATLETSEHTTADCLIRQLVPDDLQHLFQFNSVLRL